MNIISSGKQRRSIEPARGATGATPQGARHRSIPTAPCPTLAGLRYSAAAVALAAIAGCGSSGGDGPPPPPPASATLTGTVAAGAAVAHAAVAVSNAAGQSPCAESGISTDTLGVYRCTLQPGASAPFFVVATDPAGSRAPLVSVTASTPAAGSTATLNLTPLTTAILGQLAGDGNALTLVSGHAVNAGALQQLTSNVVAQLANVLAAVGAAAGFDPFTTAISAATATASGNAADRLLDLVNIITDPATGRLALSTVADPSPVALATATSAGAVLAAPPASAALLPGLAQIEALAVNACFALPVAQRALAVDSTIALAQGGPGVTTMAPDCQALTSSAGSGAGIDFRHNGYSAGQYFYSLLTANTMTGATFSVPETMALYTAATTASGVDEAVLNFKYLDANGNPGNLISVARYLPGSATAAHASDWWLTGNQALVDLNVRPLIRRLEQLNPASGNVSRFQTGLQFVVNALGPGSVGPAGTLNYARITGPGLPVAGLVMSAPVPAEVGQTSMDVLNSTGTLAGSKQCYNCPNYWFTRTAGITGSAATTLAPNFSGLTWAPTGTDISGAVKGQTYHFDLFYGSSSTPTYSIDKHLLSNLVPSTQGIGLAWNTLDSGTLAALDPTNSNLNGVLTSVTVGWVQNPSAEQISSVNVSIDTGGTFATAQAVPKGALSIVATPTPAMPALTSTSTRSFLLHYRTLDNTDKNSYFTFN